MTMIMSNLPKDLVEEILTRVPLKSMRAVRLTCTKWNALFKSRSFTKMHIDKEEEAARELGDYRMIVLMNNNLHLMSIVFNNEIPSINYLGIRNCLNGSEQVKISQVFHCEGLLLCILEDDDTKVVVWNLYLGQTRWIETRGAWEGQKSNYTYSYAIRYEKKENKSSRSHKIIRFIHDDSFLRNEIYDFDSDLWTTLDVTPPWRIPSYYHGISLKGNSYWCDRYHIISFNFTRERFESLLPMPFSIGKNDLVILSCVREEKLAVLRDDNYKLEIWITSKIEGQKISWSKFLTANAGITASGCRILCGSFFVEEEKKVAMLMNKIRSDTVFWVMFFGEAGYFRELALIEMGLPFVCSYVPSLVQIKKPDRGKRKQPKQGGKGENDIDYSQLCKS